MLYIFESQGNLASVVFDETTLSQENKAQGIPVEKLPNIVTKPGKIPVLKCSKETNEVWYDYIDEPVNEDDRLTALEDAFAEFVLGGVN